MLRIGEYIFFPAEDGKTMNRRKVGLKELEKFGFIKYLNIDDGEEYWCIANLFIGKDRRILQDDGINLCKSIDYKLSEREVEIIYDLTKAGLVEKVEEER